jgi:hypothetical protein
MSESCNYIMYIRHSSGRRQTVLCAEPLPPPSMGQCYVLACLPVPTVRVLPGRAHTKATLTGKMEPHKAS